MFALLQLSFSRILEWTSERRRNKITKCWRSKWITYPRLGSWKIHFIHFISFIHSFIHQKSLSLSNRISKDKADFNFHNSWAAWYKPNKYLLKNKPSNLSHPGSVSGHFSSGIFSSHFLSSADFRPAFFRPAIFRLADFRLGIFCLGIFSFVLFFVRAFFRLSYFSPLHFFVSVTFRPRIFSSRQFFVHAFFVS